jgi:type III pantothenate kinase
VIIAIDIGNSGLKWAAHAGEGGSDPARFVAAGALPVQAVTAQALLEAWSGVAAPSALLVCSVAAGEPGQAVAEAARRLRAQHHPLAASAHCAGVTNLYDEPAALGADRWAALIGARARGGTAALVVDAGTAMTVDALDDAGRFLGGSIVPGFELMRAALARGTARLPLAPGAYRPFARSTADAITTGAWQALAGAIERGYRSLADEVGHRPRLLLTGGGAPALMPLLAVSSDPGADAGGRVDVPRALPVLQAQPAPEILPHLVLEGLVAAWRSVESTGAAMAVGR